MGTSIPQYEPVKNERNIGDKLLSPISIFLIQALLGPTLMCKKLIEE